MRARVLKLDDIDPVPVVGGSLQWLPVRRPLDVRGFGINAYVAPEAGADVVEEHTESPDHHQELYVVVRGHATFFSDDEEIDAPAGTIVFFPEGPIKRGARAVEAGTLVLAVGGNVGEAYEPAAWEHWFLAAPHADAGDHAKAATVIAAGLTEHPDSPNLLYNLACEEVKAERLDDAAAHLARAVELDREKVTRWADGDADLDPLRSRPDWPL
jgi:hypothetical protein